MFRLAQVGKGKNKTPVHRCVCNDGYTGNGLQCVDSDGNLSVGPNDQVDVSMSLTSSVLHSSHTDGEFPVGPELEALVAGMEVMDNPVPYCELQGSVQAVSGACNGDTCTASLTETETNLA